MRQVQVQSVELGEKKAVVPWKGGNPFLREERREGEREQCVRFMQEKHTPETIGWGIKRK